MHLFIQIQHFK